MELEHDEEYKYKLPQLGNDSNLFHKINCPACSKELPASALHIADKIGTCHACNAVFSIEKELAKIKSDRSPRQEVIRPEGIDLFYFKDELDITMSQPFPVFSAILAAFTPFITLMFIGVYATEGNHPIAAIFAGLSFLTFMWSIYQMITRKKNKIHISIDDRELAIQWSPKNFVKDQNYSVDEIDQVYVKEFNTSYFVYIILNRPEGQKHVKLFIQGVSIMKAKYLEQEIEHFLGIENRKILGEVK